MLDWRDPSLKVTLADMDQEFIETVRHYAKLKYQKGIDLAKELPVHLISTEFVYSHVKDWVLNPGDTRGRAHVDELKQLMDMGLRLPPIVMNGYQPVDGKHRTTAAYQLGGYSRIPAIQLRDALQETECAPVESNTSSTVTVGKLSAAE